MVDGNTWEELNWVYKWSFDNNLHLDNKVIMKLADKLTSLRPKEIGGNTSDGYHTFDELYEHRVLLWINLVLLQHPKICYLVENHYDGWFLLGIETKDYGQISYHCPNKYLDLCKEIPRRHPEFDGHTSSDVIGRLKALANSTEIIRKG